MQVPVPAGPNRDSPLHSSCPRADRQHITRPWTEGLHRAQLLKSRGSGQMMASSASRQELTVLSSCPPCTRHKRFSHTVPGSQRTSNLKQLGPACWRQRSKKRVQFKRKVLAHAGGFGHLNIFIRKKKRFLESFVFQGKQTPIACLILTSRPGEVYPDQLEGTLWALMMPFALSTVPGPFVDGLFDATL